MWRHSLHLPPPLLRPPPLAARKHEECPHILSRDVQGLHEVSQLVAPEGFLPHWERINSHVLLCDRTGKPDASFVPSLPKAPRGLGLGFRV